MTTDAMTKSSPAAKPAAVRDAPVKVHWRTLRVLARVLVVVLLGLNAWWYWRDHRPVTDLASVSAWLDRGRAKEAEAVLEERLRRSPHDGDALALLARAQAARGDLLACARTLHAVPFWWPNKGKLLFMEGQAFKLNGRMADAELAWKELTAFDPMHPMTDSFVSKAVLELMEVYALEERWAEAHRLIWRAYDAAEPEGRPRYLVMRMRTELERIMPAASVVKLRRFVEAQPEDWEARRALAHAEYALGHIAEAAAFLAQCLRERPNDPRGWSERLRVLHEEGDIDRLRFTLARIPAEVADDPEVMLYRGQILERDGDWAGALAAYRRLTTLQPNNVTFVYRRAMVEARLGHAEEARRHHQRSGTTRSARAELPAAFNAYLDAGRGDAPKSKALAAAARRLVAICDALGWERESKAWTELAHAE
jgi:Flp pilus assembly protein TadD